MASFLDGPESTQDRWIVWREMTNNVYAKINRLMTANLNSEGGDHAELLKIYKKFMNDKVDYFISDFYPDKGCSSGKDYDLSRARMTPFVLDYAMNYADSKNSTVFSDAHDLAMETVNRCPFLDQSPDTRQKTFEAAVISESLASKPVTEFLIEKINSAITEGTPVGEIIACTNKDDDTNDPVSLYQGECELNAYFRSLIRIRDLDLGLYVGANLDSDISEIFFVRWAGTAEIAAPLIDHFKNSGSDLENLVPTVSEASALIGNVCNSLSSDTHKEILENWDTSVFTTSYQNRLDGAISNCLDNSWKDNNDWVNEHFDEFYQWVCENNDCDGINLESNEV